MIRYLQMVFCLVVALMVVGTRAMAQYPKNVLIEEFTSATCGPCVQASNVLNKILKDYSDKMVSVRYHVGEPFPHDPMYDANQSDVAARKTMYIPTGSVNPPQIRINGEATSAAPANEAEMRQALQPYLTAQSPVAVEVTQTREGNQMAIKVTATASKSEGVTGVNLYIALLEASIHYDTLTIAAWNKEKDFDDVMRKMLTNSSAVTLNPGQSKNFSFTVPIDPSWNPEELYTVAFLQDPANDNVVIQSGSSPKSTSSVATPETMAGFSLDQSTPNPANGLATIGYALGSPEQVLIELYNASGGRVASVDEGVQEPGSHRASIDVSSLPAGAYTYTITAGKYRESKMMTVVR